MIRGVNCVEIIVRDLTLEGNAEQNGCRGGAIFLIGCRDITVEHVKISNFNGEGSAINSAVITASMTI